MDCVLISCISEFQLKYLVKITDILRCMQGRIHRFFFDSVKSIRVAIIFF